MLCPALGPRKDPVPTTLACRGLRPYLCAGHSAISRDFELSPWHKTNSMALPSRGANGKDGFPWHVASSCWSRLPATLLSGAAHAAHCLKGAAQAHSPGPALQQGVWPCMGLVRLQCAAGPGDGKEMPLGLATTCFLLPLMRISPFCFGAYQADLCTLVCLEGGPTLY